MHIVIVNAHWNNRGDEAAHRALWEQLQITCPDSHITVLFKDKQPITWFPESIKADYFSCQFKSSIWDIWLATLSRGLFGKNALLKKMVKTLKKADLIIYPPGGSVINDRFFWSKQLEYLTPFLCAKLYGIPLFVAAPSIGPFDSSVPRPFRKWLLKTPQAMCVREAISQQYLETIGIKKNIHVTIDLAFMSPIDRKTNEIKLGAYAELKEFLQSHKKVVGVTISDFKWHVKLGKNKELTNKIETSFHQFAQYLTDRGYGVLLIPQLFGNQNDFDYLQQFAKDKHTFVMRDDLDTYFQQFVIAKLYAVVGMRYHCNIFAAKTATPFVAVSYEEKMDGFLTLAGLTDYSVPVKDVAFDKLVNKFQTLEKNHNQLKQKLQDQIDGWKTRALKTLDVLQTVIKR